MNNKKGAIGLSMNVLVIIIISLVILGGGVTLIYNFISMAEKQKQILDRKTEMELERLLTNSGKQIVLSLNSFSLHPGDDRTVGIGILNIKEEGYFNIEISSVKFVEDNVEVNIDDWFLYNTESFTLEENEMHKEAIMINIPNNAQKGRYIINFLVNKDNEKYGNTQKFTLTVN